MVRNITDFIKKICEGLSIFLLGIVVVAVSCTITAVPVYYLWNWLMPELFRMPVITIWQSFGLVILCSFLFKNEGSSKK